MRQLQRRRPLRLGLAVALGGLLTVAAWVAGTGVLVLLLFVTLTGVAFAALTIAPDAIALRRGHQWRWWWRSSEDEGPYWPGTRIPRSPRS